MHMITVFLGILTVGAAGALLFTIAVHPARPVHSRFELKRRAEDGDAEAAKAMRREMLIGDIVSLRRVLILVLTVMLTLLTVNQFGGVLGTVILLLFALQAYNLVYRLGWFRRWAQHHYDQFEPRLLATVTHHPAWFRLIRTRRHPHHEVRVESREQLLHLVETSGNTLTREEKLLVKHGLYFSEMTVRAIMTPARAIDTIAQDELLGPLVLDDLHKTGHSRFPVVDGGLDKIVGILSVRDLLTATSARHSVTAKKAMDSRVLYIRDDQTLDHALAGFLRARHQLFIVVNKTGATVGLISLDDVAQALVGRILKDEFDNHEDRQAVAERSLGD